jgi:divalent metal cation (Fe/Co/Zn/Cd) transporter
MAMNTCRDSCCGSAASAALLTPERVALTRQAFRLEWLPVAWMIVEGAVAIGAGVAAGSLTLTAFGLDSVIELASACVLIWRLNVELRHGQAFSERAERTASKIGGGLLFALAAYIVAGAAWSLWTRHGGAFSLPGLIVALLAIPIMTLLARRKIAIANQLGSRAMRADAVESITCGCLSLVVVVGLIVDLLLGAWWVDAVTSLAIVWFVVKEGREAWKGEDCCDHDSLGRLCKIQELCSKPSALI